MQMMPNFVLVRPHRANDEYLFNNGLKIFIDTAFEENQHAAITGDVVAICDRVYFNRKKPNISCQFDTDVIIKPGCKVWYDYRSVAWGKEEGRIINIDGKLHLIIRYDFIHLYEDLNGEIKCPNGTAIIEPVTDTLPETNLFLPDMVEDTKSKNVGKILLIGGPVRQRLNSFEIDTDEPLSVGDKVLLDKNSNIPLENELHARFKKQLLYRINISDIIGKYLN